MKKMNYHKICDKDLLTEYQFRDNIRALEELLSRHSGRVHNLCVKYLGENNTEDAMLEVMGKLIEILRTHEICNFKSWLYVVTKNHCLMKKRQTEREGLKFYDPVEFENISVENDENDNHTYIDLIQPEELREALSKLKEPQKLCIEYFYYSKKSYKEISKITGFEIKQVKSHIQNGKRNLKNYFLLNKKISDNE